MALTYINSMFCQTWFNLPDYFSIIILIMFIIIFFVMFNQRRQPVIMFEWFGQSVIRVKSVKSTSGERIPRHSQLVSMNMKRIVMTTMMMRMLLIMMTTMMTKTMMKVKLLHAWHGKDPMRVDFFQTLDRWAVIRSTLQSINPHHCHHSHCHRYHHNHHCQFSFSSRFLRLSFLYSKFIKIQKISLNFEYVGT